MGELDPQNYHPVWRRAIGEELGRASQAPGRGVPPACRCRGVPSQDLGTIYGTYPIKTKEIMMANIERRVPDGKVCWYARHCDPSGNQHTKVF